MTVALESGRGELGKGVTVYDNDTGNGNLMWADSGCRRTKSQTILKFCPDKFLGLKKRTCPGKRERLVTYLSTLVPFLS